MNLKMQMEKCSDSGLVSPCKLELCHLKLPASALVDVSALNQEKISKQKDRLSDSSRLLIRESGTEPVIRIMGESDNTELLNEVIDELVDIISAGPE